MFLKKHISSFVVQFSRSNLPPALADSFVIISPNFSLVKYFFKSFSSFFRDICSPVFWGACLSYHNKTRLSSTFLNFFQVFSSAYFIVHCLATAWLFYHYSFDLSTHFLTFFSFCCLIAQVTITMPRFCLFSTTTALQH